MKLPSGLGLALLLASTAAGATTLYKWKDANGVTQYSERPPTGGHYESRRIDSGGSTRQAGPEEAAPESPQCATARRNLEILGNGKPVMQDSDGDGQPDTELDEGQREAQRNLAEAAVKAYCARPAAGAGG